MNSAATDLAAQLDVADFAEIEALIVEAANEYPRSMCAMERARLDEIMAELDAIACNDNERTVDELLDELTVEDAPEAPIVSPAEPHSPGEMVEKPKTNFPENQTRKRRRRSDVADQELLALSRRYGLAPRPESKPGEEAAFSGEAKHLSSSSSTSSTGTLTAKPWEDTKDRAKLTYANRSLFDERGRVPHHLSIHFGPKVIHAANDNKKGAKAYIADRIMAALRPLGLNDLILVSDFSPGSGRFHVHCCIPCNDNEKPRVEAEILKAAGTWSSPRHGEKQILLKRQYDPDGWVNRYLVRKIPRSRRLSGENPVFISNSLRRKAKALYERDRAIIKSKAKEGTISVSDHDHARGVQRSPGGAQRGEPHGHRLVARHRGQASGARQHRRHSGSDRRPPFTRHGAALSHRRSHAARARPQRRAAGDPRSLRLSYIPAMMARRCRAVTLHFCCFCFSCSVSQSCCSAVSIESKQRFGASKSMNCPFGAKPMTLMMFASSGDEEATVNGE